MNSELVIKIIKNAAIYLVLIVLISFVMDSGISKLSNEPVGKVFTDWINGIIKINKLGLWVVFSLIFSYLRIRTSNK